jgi:hypothetical protein
MHPGQLTTLNALFVITLMLLMLSGGAVSSGHQMQFSPLGSDAVEPFSPCPPDVPLHCLWGP